MHSPTRPKRMTQATVDLSYEKQRLRMSIAQREIEEDGEVWDYVNIDIESCDMEHSLYLYIPAWELPRLRDLIVRHLEDMNPEPEPKPKPSLWKRFFRFFRFSGDNS